MMETCMYPVGLTIFSRILIWIASMQPNLHKVY